MVSKVPYTEAMTGMSECGVGMEAFSALCFKAVRYRGGFNNAPMEGYLCEETDVASKLQGGLKGEW